jgi:hypothetical protein
VGKYNHGINGLEIKGLTPIIFHQYFILKYKFREKAYSLPFYTLTIFLIDIFKILDMIK